MNKKLKKNRHQIVYRWTDTAFCTGWTQNEKVRAQLLLPRVQVVCFYRAKFCMTSVRAPMQVCVMCEQMAISSYREFLLKSPNHCKFYRSIRAFEWFFYFPTESLSLPLKSLEYAGVSSEASNVFLS